MFSLLQVIEVKLFTSNGFEFGGFADSEEEANALAESLC
jgi:hypothetical protein